MREALEFVELWDDRRKAAKNTSGGMQRRLQLAALRTAPAPFSLGWASREGDESLEKTVNRADQELLTVRVVERGPAGDRRGEE